MALSCSSVGLTANRVHLTDGRHFANSKRSVLCRTSKTILYITLKAGRSADTLLIGITKQGLKLTRHSGDIRLNLTSVEM